MFEFPSHVSLIQFCLALLSLVISFSPSYITASLSDSTSLFAFHISISTIATAAQGRRLTELSLWARDALATNEERLARAERILVLAEQVFGSHASVVFVCGFVCFAKVSTVCVSTEDNTCAGHLWLPAV